MSADDLPSDGNSAVKDTTQLWLQRRQSANIGPLALGGATRTTTIRFVDWTDCSFGRQKNLKVARRTCVSFYVRECDCFDRIFSFRLIAAEQRVTSRRRLRCRNRNQ